MDNNLHSLFQQIVGLHFSTPKYHKCSYCGCAQFGRDEKCMMCDTPLTVETEITKEQFDQIIKNRTNG